MAAEAESDRKVQPTDDGKSTRGGDAASGSPECDDGGERRRRRAMKTASDDGER